MSEIEMQSFRRVPHFVDAWQNASEESVSVPGETTSHHVPARGWLVTDSNRCTYVLNNDQFSQQFEANTEKALAVDVLALANVVTARLDRMEQMSRQAEANVANLAILATNADAAISALQTRMAALESVPSVAVEMLNAVQVRLASLEVTVASKG